MNLEQEFNKETGRKSYNTVNCCYYGYYVEWLEERIKQLTIPAVIKSVCDCDKWHDRMEESNNNCSTCDRPIM